MEKQEKILRLRAMLSQMAPGGKVAEVARPAAGITEGLGSGELAGLPGLGGDPVDSALDKLARGRDEAVSDAELMTLEAIIMPENRPVVFVRRTAAGLSTYDAVSSPWESLNGAAVRGRIEPLLNSIGRIEVPAAPWLPFGGTGFIVGSDLLMTNRHVARLFTEGAGTRSLVYRAGDAAVDFKREDGTALNDRTAYFEVKRVEMIHPFWDMALLRVDGIPGAFKPLRLSVRRPQDLDGHNVVVVGYPARDDRSSLELQDRIFAKKYNVKRLQPGQIRARARVSSFGNIVEAMTHDSSTLGGNSGSAILHVDTGEVVGLHFAGEYLKANYGVPTYELSRDRRVAAIKLNFDGPLPATTNDWEPAWQRVDGTEGAAVAPPPVPDANTARAAQLQSPGSQGASMDGAMTWTIPLRVTVTLGQPAAGAAAAVSAGAGAVAMPGVEMALQAPKIYGGLENRKGYQGGFLDLDEGAEVPLLALTNKAGSVVAKLEDGETELRYHRFSVVMHKGRRIALFTASNVDWRDDQRMVNGKKPSRKELTELGDNVAELWVTDWRIQEDHQLPDIFYTKDGGAFDKGHLVRRDDVCWGKNFKDIQKGNGDTYHTTNCSPQIKQFNQSAQGVDNWGDLENLIQKQTKAEKAIVFAGPAFQEDDPLFEGRADSGRIQVRIPRKFWKVIVVKGAQGPETYGFVLEQDLSAVPAVEEFAVPQQWKRYTKSIAEIEEMLNGLATMEWLKKHDRFGGEESVRISNQLA